MTETTFEGVPQDIVDACLAGLDDIRNNRGVPGDVVLAGIGRKLAEYYERQHALRVWEEDGGSVRHDR